MSQVLGAFGLLDFHHVTARSGLARVLKLKEQSISLIFQFFIFRAASNR
jgi:hypothetical protein